ncbi:capsid triplex subunit 1 [Common bottlenose dolphin gammaherpesvirus 1 strain Sarasota]|uniref:Capsid triplex subunit 1 n=1 Tax=Common bottlenose dolphin gammaherpesvirus 1 strain Sarasota TaxID=2022783 RepID=A0A1Z1NEJ7_9GAMA|nr:capsid triplex subunit 1 [Common bottlenose dolphin gammaherpesvirus 1 strain Sarasota]ARW78124.1 capsid triplex subunit 1 [Common bottlenose dolphin gammaherpesvirus 1 strain Sarasota]
MKPEPSFSYDRVRERVFRLMPPVPHKISISNGRAFAKNVKDVISKYTTPESRLQEMAQHVITYVDRPCPTVVDFLIHAQTVNPMEGAGTFLFAYKDKDDGSTIDTILTPVSLFRMSGLDGSDAEHAHRIANICYGDDSGLFDAIPNLGERLENGDFHKYLTPVGPLVQNINSTFLNKITSVMRGPCLNRASPPEMVKVIFPKDMFVDLDEWVAGPLGLSNEPKTSRVYYFAVLAYVVRNDRPALSVCFFKSMKGFSELMIILRWYYRDVIYNRMTQIMRDLYINKLLCGVVCRLGYSSPHHQLTHASRPYKGSSLPVVEISDFVSDPGSWQVLL